MKRLLVYGLALWSLTGFAKGGDSVGGGGIAENNILYSVLNLEMFITICLQSSYACGVTPEEVRLLTSIKNLMPEELKNKKLIQFESEEKKPGFFYVDGKLRIAKTGYHVGDTIYFNVDLLYPHAGTVSVPLIPPPDRPLDIPVATGILIHELGHHQGETDHTALDLLGGKIQTFMRTYSSELDGGPSRRYLLATALEYGGGSDSDLVLRDKKEAYSMHNLIKGSLKCKNGKQVDGFSLWNLHWLKETKTGSTVRIPLRMRTVVRCGYGTDQQVETPELELGVYLKEAGVFSILNDKTTLTQLDCSVANPACH